jgi:hypothetical protein
MSLKKLCSIHTVRVLRWDGGTDAAMGAVTTATDAGVPLKCRVRPIASSEQTQPSMHFKNRMVNHIVDFVFDPQIDQMDDLIWVDKNIVMKVESVARDFHGLGRRWQCMATSYDAANLSAGPDMA